MNCAAVTRIFREDEAILEAQQIALSVYPGAPCSLHCDPVTAASPAYRLKTTGSEIELRLERVFLRA